MTRKHIGRIGITLGLGLGIAGCGGASSPSGEVAAGNTSCYWRKSTSVANTPLVCTVAAQIVVIDTSGVPERSAP